MVERLEGSSIVVDVCTNVVSPASTGGKGTVELAPSETLSIAEVCGMPSVLMSSIEDASLGNREAPGASRVSPVGVTE